MKLFASSRLPLCTIFGYLVTSVYGMDTPPTFQFIVTQTSFDFHNVSSWSGGGGSPQDIPADSGHPFAGRQFGGGDRSGLRGTRVFGSGYPHGVTDNTTVAGRSFPYGVWPLYWGNNISGSDEYGPDLDAIRPGGPLVIQRIALVEPKWNVTIDEVYYHITDRDTALAIMTSFATWCDVEPTWPTIYEPGNSSNLIGIENVIQYYRASSYALAFKGYNNSLALNTNSTTSYDQSDPLPDTIQYSPFRQCLDGVIVDALPIVDGPPKKESPLALILGILLTVFWIPLAMLIFVILAAIWSCIRGLLC